MAAAPVPPPDTTSIAFLDHLWQITVAVGLAIGGLFSGVWLAATRAAGRRTADPPLAPPVAPADRHPETCPVENVDLPAMKAMLDQHTRQIGAMQGDIGQIKESVAKLPTREDIKDLRDETRELRQTVVSGLLNRAAT